jgi:hypothetical protein
VTILRFNGIALKLETLRGDSLVLVKMRPLHLEDLGK